MRGSQNVDNNPNTVDNNPNTPLGDIMLNTGDKQSFPHFNLAGQYDGSISASRWLLRLKYDFRRAGHDPPSPQLFLRSVNMLLDGTAAERLDSTPRIRRIMNNLFKATEKDVEIVEEWLLEEFPAKVSNISESNIQSEMESFAQKKDEALVAYYQRAQTLLRRAHARDKPRTGSESAVLTQLEEFVLSMVVLAFVKGIEDDRLRRTVIEKGGATCGALYKSYEIVQSTQRSLEVLDQIEREQQNRLRLAKLKDLVEKQYGRPANAVLADIDAGNKPSNF